MTDREMLELAAKAAGISYTVSQYGNLQAHNHPCGGEMIVWNPLTDDGDALRLAVELRLSISPPHKGYRAFVQSEDRKHGVQANCGVDNLDEQDPLAATRRAIVRAAALIGKMMP